MSNKYNVHLYAEVRVKVVSVEADSMEEAIDKAEGFADPNRYFGRNHCRNAGMDCDIADMHLEYSEFAEGCSYVVDVQGDDDYEQTQYFNQEPERDDMKGASDERLA